MDFYADEMGGFSNFLRRPPVGASTRRFDEYFRCYPVVMMSGPERDNANHGGKIFLPASALEKLTRLHITYPMLFELTNGAEEKTTHAGVLEFIAEEGRVYLPFWLMKTLSLDPGDLVQVKSTDLPPGQLIKLQPQSPNFLEISDPRAVLENAFRNFACLTKGDIFTFSYNDTVYEIAVLEIKPDTDQHAIVTMETDLSVEFAVPVGYKEPQRSSGASTPRSGMGVPVGGTLQFQGTMAQSINYAAIAPNATTAAAGAKAVASNFLLGGQRLSAKKGAKPPTPKPSTPVAGASTNPDQAAVPIRRINGPQPLRLPPGKLFFGYEIKPNPKKKTEENGAEVATIEKKPVFQGQGQTLRAKRRGDGGGSGTGSGTGSGVNSDVETKGKGKDTRRKQPPPPSSSSSTGIGTGRTLR